MQVFTAVIIRSVIGAAEPASFDAVSEIIRTNHYEWVSIGSAASTDMSSGHSHSSEKTAL